MANKRVDVIIVNIKNITTGSKPDSHANEI